jgi:hypothetical protein
VNGKGKTDRPGACAAKDANERHALARRTETAGEEIQAGPKTEQNPSSSDPAHYAGTVSEKSSGDGKIKNGERPDLGKEQPKTHEEISTKIKSFLHNKLNESSTQSEGGYRIHSLI